MPMASAMTMTSNGPGRPAIVAGSSVSPTTKSSVGCAARARAIIGSEISTPTPFSGFSAASSPPVPQPISNTRNPSGIRNPEIAPIVVVEGAVLGDERVAFGRPAVGNLAQALLARREGPRRGGGGVVRHAPATYTRVASAVPQ